MISEAETAKRVLFTCTSEIIFWHLTGLLLLTNSVSFVIPIWTSFCFRAVFVFRVYRLLFPTLFGFVLIWTAFCSQDCDGAFCCLQLLFWSAVRFASAFVLEGGSFHLLGRFTLSAAKFSVVIDRSRAIEIEFNQPECPRLYRASSIVSQGSDDVFYCLAD